jgi:hypothetical protein
MGSERYVQTQEGRNTRETQKEKEKRVGKNREEYVQLVPPMIRGVVVAQFKSA